MALTAKPIIVLESDMDITTTVTSVSKLPSLIDIDKVVIFESKVYEGWHLTQTENGEIILDSATKMLGMLNEQELEIIREALILEYEDYTKNINFPESSMYKNEFVFLSIFFISMFVALLGFLYGISRLVIFISD